MTIAPLPFLLPQPVRDEILLSLDQAIHARNQYREAFNEYERDRRLFIKQLKIDRRVALESKRFIATAEFKLQEAEKTYAFALKAFVAISMRHLAYSPFEHAEAFAGHLNLSKSRREFLQNYFVAPTSIRAKL